MKTPKTKVIEVKEAPKLNNPVILQGIRDKAAAETWGMKNGHSVVYFIAKKQRVYAERLHTRVDEQAKVIEKKAVQLLMFAEDGTAS